MHTHTYAYIYIHRYKIHTYNQNVHVAFFTIMKTEDNPALSVSASVLSLVSVANQNQLGEESVHSLREAETGAWRQELSRNCRGTLLTDAPPVLLSYFLYHPRTTCPEGALPTMDWVLLPQALIKKMPQSCPQTSLREAIPQLRFPPPRGL